jgi:hypothetical protein
MMTIRQRRLRPHFDILITGRDRNILYRFGDGERDDHAFGTDLNFSL